MILWSPEAIDELASLRAYIAEDNPAVARRVALRIIHSIEQLLAGQPRMGRAGRVSGTRELMVPEMPYVIPYRIRNNRLQVLRVYHGACRWPDQFRG
ncbi:MAG: type II toxin-antitoxin system RelE/ParE family toxin [Rhizobiales bacterium]|nr:type II toxin-antitoxin system RelE/ParE family toxin [Hyphomicrobiales bacterium]